VNPIHCVPGEPRCRAMAPSLKATWRAGGVEVAACPWRMRISLRRTPLGRARAPSQQAGDAASENTPRTPRTPRKHRADLPRGPRILGAPRETAGGSPASGKRRGRGRVRDVSRRFGGVSASVGRTCVVHPAQRLELAPSASCGYLLPRLSAQQLLRPRSTPRKTAEHLGPMTWP